MNTKLIRSQGSGFPLPRPTQRESFQKGEIRAVIRNTIHTIYFVWEITTHVYYFIILSNISSHYTRTVQTRSNKNTGISCERGGSGGDGCPGGWRAPARSDEWGMRRPAGVRVTHATRAVGLHVSPTPLATHQLHPHAHHVNNAHYWHTWYLKQYQKNWVLNIASQGIRLPYCWQAGRQQMWQPACDSVGCTWAWGCGRGGDASLASRPRLSGCNNGFIKAQQREAERPSVPITEKVQ